MSLVFLTVAGEEVAEGERDNARAPETARGARGGAGKPLRESSAGTALSQASSITHHNRFHLADVVTNEPFYEVVGSAKRVKSVQINAEVMSSEVKTSPRSSCCS